MVIVRYPLIFFIAEIIVFPKSCNPRAKLFYKIIFLPIKAKTNRKARRMRYVVIFFILRHVYAKNEAQLIFFVCSAKILCYHHNIQKCQFKFFAYRKEEKRVWETIFSPRLNALQESRSGIGQDERLVKTVRRVYEKVEYYRNLMEQKGVTPDDIRSVDDLYKLPFLTKDDLRDAYPFGLLAVPLRDAVRIQSTSGTTGRRVVAFYTQHDIDLWDECCARAIVAAGGTKDDVVHVCYGYGLFTGGPGLNGGSHKVGSLTLPMSSGKLPSVRYSSCATSALQYFAVRPLMRRISLSLSWSANFRTA